MIYPSPEHHLQLSETPFELVWCYDGVVKLVYLALWHLIIELCPPPPPVQHQQLDKCNNNTNKLPDTNIL